MKRSPFYLPLTLAILFGLAIGTISISPVYGDNVPGCQGTGNSSASVILAGRVLTPSTLLRTANGQPCAANEANLNLVSMTRTMVVSPNDIPTQNGTALLAAITTISNANPSAANPWLLKLEPGNYDLGNAALMLKPYVDLEGSGEGTTTISSTSYTANFPSYVGTVVLTSSTELRFVKVVNSSSGDRSQALVVPDNATNVRVTHVTALASNSGANKVATGLFNSTASSLLVQDSTFTSAIAGSNNTGSVSGITNSGDIRVQNSYLATSGGSTSYSLNTNNGTVMIQNSILTATNGSGFNSGLYNAKSVSTVLNSSLSSFAPPGSNQNYGYGIVNSNNGVVTVQNSRLSATGNTTNFGFFNTNFNGTITATIQSSILTTSGGFASIAFNNTSSGAGTAIANMQNSTLSASGGTNFNVGLSNSGGTASIGASQLVGLTPFSGTIKCVASYDGGFNPLAGC